MMRARFIPSPVTVGLSRNCGFRTGAGSLSTRPLLFFCCLHPEPSVRCHYGEHAGADGGGAVLSDRPGVRAGEVNSGERRKRGE